MFIGLVACTQQPHSPTALQFSPLPTKPNCSGRTLLTQTLNTYTEAYIKKDPALYQQTIYAEDPSPLVKAFTKSPAKTLSFAIHVIGFKVNGTSLKSGRQKEPAETILCTPQENEEIQLNSVIHASVSNTDETSSPEVSETKPTNNLTVIFQQGKWLINGGL